MDGGINPEGTVEISFRGLGANVRTDRKTIESHGGVGLKQTTGWISEKGWVNFRPTVG